VDQALLQAAAAGTFLIIGASLAINAAR